MSPTTAVVVADQTAGSLSGAIITGLCQNIRRVPLYLPSVVNIIFLLFSNLTVIPESVESITVPLPLIMSNTLSLILTNSLSNLFITTPIRLSKMHKIHEYITTWMSNSWFVENLLIAKYDDVDEDGNTVQVDCIYCTILRVAIIFFLAGSMFGTGLGDWMWQLSF